MTKHTYSGSRRCQLSLLVLFIIVAAYGGEVIYQKYVRPDFKSPSRIYSLFGRIYYKGAISRGDALILQDLVDNSFIAPRVVSIDSGGGDIYEAMKIGAIVKSGGLDLEVKSHCLSACANYIFPAARKKVLYEDSLLGWHGSLGSDDGWFMQPTLDVDFADGQFVENQVTYSLGSLPEEWKSRVDLIGHRKAQNMERSYFAHIGTSELLPICGQMQNVQDVDLESMKSPDGLSPEFFQSMKWHFFYYSIPDLRRFGITDIELKGDEMRWMKHQEQSDTVLATFCQK